ncbi:FAD-dependent oxidoreductase [Synechococcus elongatus]|uniref:FAD-dependent oxidoreductase n=1 Tax=Synechococcus elongatus TaxID=32046 RepID=UPI000F7DB6C4|nr:FAD-dependent oxidoreductase [Synechococcus elongatus]
MLETLRTDVLIVGGGTGGTAAALQAARRGAQTILVSEGPWLGGMLTSAGVSAPDGNELRALQTGIWGAFLKALRQRQPDGLNHAWVSFFTYDPRVGSQIFADWVRELPNLKWIQGDRPRAVIGDRDRLRGVEFEQVRIEAKVVIDATELGDLLALADVPHRWGWEPQEEWQEPSAPTLAQLESDDRYQRYPVQSPTWVVVMADQSQSAPPIPASTSYNPDLFAGAWQTPDNLAFLDYGRLPGDRFMINWPGPGNDYGEGLQRLIQGNRAHQEWMQEAIAHSQAFAHHIQAHWGDRYGLARDQFPQQAIGGGAFALQPYYRESRRVVGSSTITELDLLPLHQGQVAKLPCNASGQVSAIAIGNYANDHHYPNWDFRLQPKSMRWGGRWTGTAFSLPYDCLLPVQTEGLLVCEKNIAVSHIANGATRLQPVVLGLGQAAGMAAALAVEQNCDPRSLSVRDLQEALLTDSEAPQAIVPLYDTPPEHPDWLTRQRAYLDRPEAYPATGVHGGTAATSLISARAQTVSGQFERLGDQNYQLDDGKTVWQLVTLDASIDQQFKALSDRLSLAVVGLINPAGHWLIVEAIHP